MAAGTRKRRRAEQVTMQLEAEKVAWRGHAHVACLSECSHQDGANYGVGGIYENTDEEQQHALDKEDMSCLQ